MEESVSGITRREALRRVSLLLGATISAPTLAGVLGGCEGRTPEAGWRPRALSAPQHDVVAAVAEHILPRTDTPGATDAGVGAFVDTMLADYYPAPERARFLAGLGEFDRRAREAYGAPFLRGTPEQQLALVVALDEEAFPAGDAARQDPAAAQRNPVTQQGQVQTGRGGSNDPGAVSASGGTPRDGATAAEQVDVRSTYRTLKELTLVGYYTSQAGATKELRVNPFGAYRGDIPYADLRSAWA